MRRWGILISVSLLAAACGLSISGTESTPSIADASSGDATIDSANSSSDATSNVDAENSLDASFDGAAFDAGNIDGSACVDAGPVGENGIMTGVRSTMKKTIDANFSDWSCTPLFTMSPLSAGAVRGTTTDVAVFGVEWDTDGIYFAVLVADPSVQGNDTNDPYMNDAVDLYLAGEPPDGSNNSDTFHVIVDYKNLAKQYSGGPAFDPPSGFVSSAQLAMGGYQVEMFVPKSAFGISTMAPATLGFDVQLNDNDGTPQSGVLWFSNPSSLPDQGICGSPTTTEPACDTFAYGKVKLDP